MKKKVAKVFKHSLLFSLVAVCMSTNAGVVRDDVDYQQFRDFAENKGKFHVGATNVPIFKKDGTEVEKMFTNGIIMPDWSAVNTRGTESAEGKAALVYKKETVDENGTIWFHTNTVFTPVTKGHATLIHPQYVTGVSHVGIVQHIGFGGNTHNIDHEDMPYYVYTLIKGNDFINPEKYADFLESVKTEEDLRNYPSNGTLDYYQPRLHKLVTEVAPVETVNGQHELKDQKEVEAFKKRYPLLLRMGSGIQKVINPTTKKITDLVDSYEFLIGGNTLDLVALTTENAASPDRIQKDVINMESAIAYENLPAMATYGQSGDSGSPVYAYDTQETNPNKKWKLLSSWQGSIEKYYTTLNKDDFNQEKRKEDNNLKNIINQQAGQAFNWAANGNTSSISSSSEQFELPIYDKDAIHELYARFSQIADNAILNNVTVAARSAQEKIAPSKRDDWGNVMKHPTQKNSTGEALNLPNQEAADIKAKLNHGKNLTISGEKGTLNLKSDINQGAGALYFETDFTVKGETNNTTWLGAGVSVADGKTVDWQIKNPQNDRLSKIGAGTLHVNGTGDNLGDISVGDGTVILNQTGGGQAFNQVGIVSGRPIVRLANNKQVKPENIYFGFRGGRLDVNGNNLTFNYIRNIDEGAMIVNHNASQAATITLKANAQNPNQAAFNGVFGETNPSHHNGKLNVVYAPENPSANQPFLLSGGMNLNGNLTVDSGNLLLSGRPTPHAYNHLDKIEPFQDNDWVNRTFSASQIVAQNNAKLTVGRNVKDLIANIQLNQNATAILGFINGATPVCVRSDYFGTTSCEHKTYNDDVLQTIPTTNITGNVTLKDNAKLMLGKAHLLGKTTASENTYLTLGQDTKWTMTNDSQVGHLQMEDGSQITLNSNFENGLSDKFNFLTVAGNLTGKGKFNYLTNLKALAGDKVQVNGDIMGDFLLNVKNQGNEPAKSKEYLTLLTALGSVDKAPKLANAGEVVDLGAYRYTLKSDDGKVYYLWSEGLDKEKTDTEKTDTSTPTDYGKKTQSQYISKYTNLALSAQHADIRAVVRATTLAGRVLDVHPKHTGIWLHTNHSEFDRSSDYYRAYSDEQDLVQFGVDDDFDVGKGVLIFGTALSHAKGNQTFDEGTGKSRLTMAHLYGKWSSKDVFLGMDAGYGQVNQDIQLGKSAHYRQNFANVGMVAGKTWQFSNSFIEPSVGIRHYQAFDSNAYTIDGANVRLLNFSATAYQPSLKFGYTHQTATGLTFSPYVSTTYGHWTGSSKLMVNDYQFAIPLVSEWQHKLGFDIQKGKFSGQLYTTYDKDKESGDGYSVGLNAGYRW
ncbi:S6 family peptidase [Moraxella oblonga]|uniref:S6 family peptidase n=1 Tax=Moraxella oblonga TaxID=200413 RepID=UPI00083526A7|nr:S6 family peptidase [Moraxella oblonga]